MRLYVERIRIRRLDEKFCLEFCWEEVGGVGVEKVSSLWGGGFELEMKCKFFLGFCVLDRGFFGVSL